MNYQEFCHFLRTKLPEHFPENCYFNFRRSGKAPGNTRDVLCIEFPGETESPQFDLQAYYALLAKGVSPACICEKLENDYAEAAVMTAACDAPKLTREEALPRLVRCLTHPLNAPLSPAELPHRPFLDLLLFYAVIDERHPFLPVSRELAEGWSLSEKALYEITAGNMSSRFPWQLLPIEKMISDLSEDFTAASEENLFSPDGPRQSSNVPPAVEICGTETSSGSLPGISADRKSMYVLSTRECWHGASVITENDCLPALAELFGAFYLLPSSIHEWIVLPETERFSPEMLKDTVTEVNRLLVSDAERLSGHVYAYNSEKGLRIVL